MFCFYLADIFLKCRRKIFKGAITLTWDFSCPKLLFGTKYSAVEGLRKSNDEILTHGSQGTQQCCALPVLCSQAAALHQCQPKVQKLPESSLAPALPAPWGFSWAASMCWGKLYTAVSF